MDLFLYGLDEEAATEKVKQIYAAVKLANPKVGMGDRFTALYFVLDGSKGRAALSRGERSEDWCVWRGGVDRRGGGGGTWHLGAVAGAVVFAARVVREELCFCGGRRVLRAVDGS